MRHRTSVETIIQAVKCIPVKNCLKNGHEINLNNQNETCDKKREKQHKMIN